MAILREQAQVPSMAPHSIAIFNSLESCELNAQSLNASSGDIEPKIVVLVKNLYTSRHSCYTGGAVVVI